MANHCFGSQSPKLTIAIIGGDGRHHAPRLIRATFRTFGSSRYGSGNTRSAVAAIRSGTLGLVVLLVRWLGHPESHVLASTCRGAGVPILVVDGGMSAAWRAVRRFIAARGHS
jgi:hypothetical protein